MGARTGGVSTGRGRGRGRGGGGGGVRGGNVGSEKIVDREQGC